MRWILVVLFACSPAFAAPSDADSLRLLDLAASFNPEEASRYGLDKWDDKAIDLGPGYEARRRRALSGMAETLEKRRRSEKDAATQGDLEILLKWLRLEVRSSELEEKYLVSYYPLERMIFGGLRPVLDDQVEPARRQKMVTRLRIYAGLEPGSTSLCKLAEARMRERMRVPGLLMPVKAEVEKNLMIAEPMLRGLEQLLKKYQLVG